MKEYNELCTRYKTDDERFRLQYEVYKRAIERLSNLPGCDIVDEMEFDIKNQERGIQNQLERLYEKELAWELENAKATAELHLSIANDIMTRMGYSLIICDRGAENDLANVAYYTKKGWDGVVMQVVSTANGVERKLIGVSRNGERTDPKQIKKIAKQNEKENEPIEFVKAFSQNGLTNCKIRKTGDVTTYTENVLEFIENDIVLDFSEDRLVEVNNRTVTAWELFNDITQTGVAEKKSTYKSITNKCTNADEYMEGVYESTRKMAISSTKKKYQTK